MRKQALHCAVYIINKITTTIMKTTTNLNNNIYGNVSALLTNDKAFMKAEAKNSDYLIAFFNQFLSKNVDYSIITDDLKTSCDAITFEIDTLLSKAFNISLIESKIRHTDYSEEGYTLDFHKWSRLKKIAEQNKFTNILYINFIPVANKIYIFDVTNLNNEDFNQERTVNKYTVIESAKEKRKYINLQITDAIFTTELDKLELKEKNEKVDIKNLNIKQHIYLNEAFRITNLIKKYTY